LIAAPPHIDEIDYNRRPLVTSDPDIDKLVVALHGTYKVEYLAPGHCTGEPAFSALKKSFADRYLYAGVGTTLDLLHWILVSAL
jgi:7,8-dihydropterin-6-yl-methyl-4-(beta-D-ribofuranosyl)aminobenzene 5'-phosphate synthase